MAKEVKIEISELKTSTIPFTIIGKTPLISHAWSDKAKREMLEKQQGKKTTKKHEIKIPMNDFMSSLYWLTEKPELGATDEESEQIWADAIANGARFGFPVTGIKQAIVTGAYRAGLDVKMTELKGSFFLRGLTEHSTTDIAEIIAKPPQIREDMVRVGGVSKTADIRYRAEFLEWEIPLEMEYEENGKYTLQQIMNCINYGGRYCGLGEWRVEKGGQSGMFELKR